MMIERAFPPDWNRLLTATAPPGDGGEEALPRFSLLPPPTARDAMRDLDLLPFPFNMLTWNEDMEKVVICRGRMMSDVLLISLST